MRFLRFRREALTPDAEDSVSNLFLSLFERALNGALIDPPRHWPAYLRTAVRRHYEMDIRNARRATPRARDVDLALALYDGLRPDLEAADRDEIRRMFERAVTSLGIVSHLESGMLSQVESGYCEPPGSGHGEPPTCGSS
jgi:DNA-directed RNA polymerase specialized sigma24 family protein